MNRSRPLLLCALPLILAGGCAEPAPELRQVRVEHDDLRQTHVRSRQTTRGVAIEGAELIEHFDAHGRLVAVDSTLRSDVDTLELRPTLTAEAARARATRAAKGTVTDVDDGELEVFAVHRRAVLAYRFTVRTAAPNSLLRVTIDAKTGDVLETYDDLETIRASGRSVGGAERSFEVSAAPSADAAWIMVDTTSAAEIRTTSASQSSTLPGSLLTSDSLEAWDVVPHGGGAAVDAHANARIVIDHLRTVHGRSGIDGAGGAFTSTVHFGVGLDDAFYDPDANVTAYGDGAGLYRPLSAALDVVAHEMVHGLTHATSGLRYVGESGALNEAISDILACFIEHRALPDATKNWTIGESVAKTPGGAIRDLRNPTAHSQPEHMLGYVVTQLDNGGVHVNSGIPAHAAFLMTMGGTNGVSGIRVPSGIGWEHAERIWYRAATVYFLASTDFRGAADATVKAAADLGLTAQEQATVACAWKAVGVLPGTCVEPRTDPAPPSTSTAFAPVDGDTAGNDEPEQGGGADTPTSGARQRGASCRAAPPGGGAVSARGAASLVLVAMGGLVARLRRRRARAEEVDATG